MTDVITDNICAHVACGCEVQPGSEYCCLECENDKEGTDCSCGHVDCHATA